MDEGVAGLIRKHLARYPEAAIPDVYKLLHQACFGPGHLVPNHKLAREWLEQESAQQTPSAAECLVESVHPDGAIVRLHLRPYLTHTADLKPLLNAFVRSAEQVRGDAGTMAAAWATFEALCRSDEACDDRFETREVRLFGRMRAAEHWPAVHHSPRYNRTYRPVYRVLTLAEAQGLCQLLGVPLAVD